MGCPKCKSKNVFHTHYPNLVKHQGRVIDRSPQYSCLDCSCKWDIIIRSPSISHIKKVPNKG